MRVVTEVDRPMRRRRCDCSYLNLTLPWLSNASLSSPLAIEVPAGLNALTLFLEICLTYSGVAAWTRLVQQADSTLAHEHCIVGFIHAWSGFNVPVYWVVSLSDRLSCIWNSLHSYVTSTSQSSYLCGVWNFIVFPWQFRLEHFTLSKGNWVVARI